MELLLMFTLAGGTICAAGCWLATRTGRDADEAIKRIVKEAEQCRNYHPPPWAEELRLEATKQRAMAATLNEKWARRAVRSYRKLYKRRRP